MNFKVSRSLLRLSPFATSPTAAAAEARSHVSSAAAIAIPVPSHRRNCLRMSCPLRATKTQRTRHYDSDNSQAAMASTTSETEDEMDTLKSDTVEYIHKDLLHRDTNILIDANISIDANKTHTIHHDHPRKNNNGSVGSKRRREPVETATALCQLDAHIESEMGIVEEIYCENFMCHRKLRVALCPHTNFITGENGSGKSAIIAALQICLGASARSTHRGKSIKNLIRHGHEGNALVRITLRNDAVGSDAFRPELFGRKILVERLIRRDGSAEYRLRDEKGVLVSKLKTDLEAMLDHLNIQTENPCAILDQENAKLFLKGNSQDKYKFFLQSTDLYKMRTTYSKIDEETRNIAESTLKRERAKIATLKSAMDEATKQWKEAQSIGMLEDEFEVLKKELAWSFVCEKEALAAKVEKKMKRKKRDAERAADEYEEARKAVDKLEQKQKEKNDKLEEVNARMSDNSQRKGEVKNKIREARRPLHNCKAEIKQLTQSKQRANQRLARLQHDLQKKRENHEVMLRNRMQRNDEMRERIEMTRREVQESEHEINKAKECAQARPLELDEVENRYDTCARQMREAEMEVNKIQQRINLLKDQKRDSLAVYGNRIPQLQQLIRKNRHRFAAPPYRSAGS
uniref:Rad50/SbcC-type AAA domain-containing protein n=1 Tax=Peronospora matthiolae TaxID=2874970 RepID=A0AAV1TE85_9STRA